MGTRRATSSTAQPEAGGEDYFERMQRAKREALGGDKDRDKDKDKDKR